MCLLSFTRNLRYGRMTAYWRTVQTDKQDFVLVAEPFENRNGDEDVESVMDTYL